MPTLARINVYPVKSLDGLAVPSCQVLPSGALAHDRRFAMRDSAGEFINGKRVPATHLLRLEEFAAAGGLNSAADLLQVESLYASNRSPDKSPDGIPIFDRERAEAWLRERFGRRVTLVEHDLAGFPDDPDAPGPTVVSTATLQEVASWFASMDMDEARARFRANLEIDDVPAFWEDRLYAAAGQAVRFRLGEVVFEGVNPCQRCVVPTRAATTGEVWPEFAKIFSRRRAESLPPWADRSRFDHFYKLCVNTRLSPVSQGGMVRVGDKLSLQ